MPNKHTPGTSAVDRKLVALIACQETATRALHKSLLSDLTRMPKGKAKGVRRGPLTGAERRAGVRCTGGIARTVVANSASTRRGSEFVADAAAFNIVALNVNVHIGSDIGRNAVGDSECASSVSAVHRSPIHRSPDVTVASATTAARPARPRIGPRAPDTHCRTRRHARRATST